MSLQRRTFFRHLAIAGAALMTVDALARSTAASSSPAPTGGKTIYTCSMHPQVRQEKPGNCPICNMTLVKEKA